MDTTQIIVACLSAIVTIAGVLITVIWQMMLARVKVSEQSLINHDRRIQKVEDVFTITIENLTKKVEELSLKVDNLATQVHKEKNEENKISSTMVGLLKFVEKGYEQHEKIIVAINNLNKHYEKTI
ncbi:MAG: hypothetical protein WCP61_08890 [Chitinophagia bacterium]|jgi:hypothetical protein